MALKLTKSAELFKTASERIPGGVNSPVRSFASVGGHPIYFDKASGSRFTDVDGNEYVDFCQSWGPLILGHSYPDVVEAVREAAGRGLSFGACHEKELELARYVLSGFPEMDKVRFVSSGTEAVMTALRLARGATGRDLVVKFEGCYHGHFDGMMVKAGSGLATQSISTSKGIPEDIAKTTLVLPLASQSAIADLFRSRGDEIAAVIIEPLPANNGLLPQHPSLLAFLRDVTETHGSLLIFDEVISGFRLHYGGFSPYSDVFADMVTLGKIIGGGMPVGAVIGRSSVMDHLAPVGKVYQAGTLSGNPVSLAAGCATLDFLSGNRYVYEAIENLTRSFVQRLEGSGVPFARAQRFGTILWPYFDEGEFPTHVGEISDLAMQRFNKIYWKLLERGYYLPPSSYEVLFPSLMHTEEEMIGLADAIIEELKAIS